MEGAGVLHRGAVQVLDGADGRAAVDVGVVSVVADHEALEPAVGRGQHALAQLFLDDVALGLEHGLVHHRAGHALGVGPEHGLQILGRDGLVVVGEVGTGGGVAGSAHVLGQGVHGAQRHVDRLARQDVLEQVGEARAAGGVVLGAHVVPDLDRHRAGCGIGHGVDVEAVGQRAVVELKRRGRQGVQRGRLRRLRQGGTGEGQRKERGGQQGEALHESGFLTAGWAGMDRSRRAARVKITMR